MGRNILMGAAGAALFLAAVKAFPVLDPIRFVPVIVPRGG